MSEHVHIVLYLWLGILTLSVWGLCVAVVCNEKWKRTRFSRQHLNWNYSETPSDIRYRADRGGE